MRARMARPPDATGRLILILGLGCLASTLATRALDPLVGVLAAEFGTGPAAIALLGTAYALPYALVQPVLGPVGDAIGKRLVIRAGLLLLAAALLASAFAPDLLSLAALRVLAGAASGGIFRSASPSSATACRSRRGRSRCPGFCGGAGRLRRRRCPGRAARAVDRLARRDGRLRRVAVLAALVLGGRRARRSRGASTWARR
jgi:hypothetical protein